VICFAVSFEAAPKEAMHGAGAKNAFVAWYLDIQNPSNRANHTMEMDEVIEFISYLQRACEKLSVKANCDRIKT